MPFSKRVINKITKINKINSQNNITTNAAISMGDEVDNISDIGILTSKIQGMTNSLANWSTGVTILMAITAIVGVFYFIASVVARQKAVELGSAKDELIQQMDQASKKEIAIAKAQADQGNAKAAKANEMAAQANERAEQMELRVEELKKENLKLEIKLEEERNARLEIERRLAPRFLTSKRLRNINLPEYGGIPTFEFPA